MITPDMRKRLAALLPDEAMPQGDYLRLSDDKAFCMKEMMRSMQNSMAQSSVLSCLETKFFTIWQTDKGGI